MSANEGKPRGAKPAESKGTGSISHDGQPCDYENSARTLLLRALNGDNSAARSLVHAAEAYTEAIHELFDAVEVITDEKWVHPNRNVLREIAADQVRWPCMVSRHRRFAGNPEDIREYLEKLNLGGSEPLHFDACDSRSQAKWLCITFVLAGIKERGFVVPVCGGLSRDAWLASENGKAVRREVSEVLERPFQQEDWKTCFLRPLVESAMKTTANQIRKRNGLDPGEPVSASDRAIKTAIIKDVCSLIHGMLKD